MGKATKQKTSDPQPAIQGTTVDAPQIQSQLQWDYIHALTEIKVAAILKRAISGANKRALPQGALCNDATAMQDLHRVQRCCSGMYGVEPDTGMHAPNGTCIPFYIEPSKKSNVLIVKHASEIWKERCVVTSESSVFKVRYPPAQDKHCNPDGITLFCIMHELMLAMEAAKSMPAYIEGAKHRMKCQQADSLGPLRESTALVQRFLSTVNVIDGAEDDKRAKFIQQHPAALLFSPEHQDAVARWIYAKRFGAGNDKTGPDVLLGKALDGSKNPGKRRVHHVHPVFFRQAYNDLVRYVKGLRASIKENSSSADVRQVFPDCDFLWINPDSGKSDDRIIALVMTKKKNKLAVVGTAIDFITRHTGMRKTIIFKLLNKTKK